MMCNSQQATDKTMISFAQILLILQLTYTAQVGAVLRTYLTEDSSWEYFVNRKYYCEHIIPNAR